MVIELLLGRGGGAAGGGTAGGEASGWIAGGAAGAVSGALVWGTTGTAGPSEGRVSKGWSGPILIVSCACMPAGARNPWARMIDRTALHQRANSECLNMRRCGMTLDQSTHGLRHSLESSLEAAALSAIVSVCGSHFKPVLPLRRAMLARCAMVMLRCETSMGVAVGLPS